MPLILQAARSKHRHSQVRQAVGIDKSRNRKEARASELVMVVRACLRGRFERRQVAGNLNVRSITLNLEQELAAVLENDFHKRLA